VNLEVDVLARYLERMLETMSPAAARGGEGAAA
jgi:riboflavin synthase alpha subunit